jgi:hypothetical protein
MVACAPRVPPEICDAAIDCLHSDTSSLRSCVLVCHSFVPRSRLHMWSVEDLPLAARDRMLSIVIYLLDKRNVNVEYKDKAGRLPCFGEQP